jgi:hypothetical protein
MANNRDVKWDRHFMHTPLDLALGFKGAGFRIMRPGNTHRGG